MTDVFSQPWFGVVWTILGILLGAAVVLKWAQSNGQELGRRIGRALPGNQVEKFLVEFIDGLRRGLEETMTETTVHVTQEPASGEAKTIMRLELRDNTLTGKATGPQGRSGSSSS